MSDQESYCTFNIRGATCGLPVRHVREIVCDQPITPVPLAHSSLRGLINLRGQILTVVDIGSLMGLAVPDSSSSHGRYHVIAELGDELVSLTVDEMGPVVTPHPNEMEQPPNNLDVSAAELITAAARLPEHVLLILDVDRIMDLHTSTSNYAGNERI